MPSQAGLNPEPSAPEADALTTRPARWSDHSQSINRNSMAQSVNNMLNLITKGQPEVTVFQQLFSFIVASPDPQHSFFVFTLQLYFWCHFASLRSEKSQININVRYKLLVLNFKVNQSDRFISSSITQCWTEHRNKRRSVNSAFRQPQLQCSVNIAS